jgi:hypothetical protein
MDEGSVHGPTYFLAVLHPPPSPQLKAALGDYAFTLSELFKVAPQIAGLPVMVEHAGIHDAIDSTMGPQGQLASRNEVIARLHDLGESDATKSVVGQVLSAEIVETSGALYAIFQINKGLDWVAWLVRNGFLTGVSLTTLETTHNIRPYEVSLTKDPARPHCFIQYHSNDLDKVRSYMRRVHNGSMRDLSSTLQKPYRVMAASAAAMQVDTPVSPASSITGEALMAAINAHPDVSQRTLLLASIDQMTARALESQKQTADTLAQLEKLEAERISAEKRGKVNMTMMESSLRAHRATTTWRRKVSPLTTLTTFALRTAKCW